MVDLQGNCPLETHLRIYLCKVPPSRCCNFDETSVCLLPLGTLGWKDKQELAMAATDGKLRCTKGLEMHKECGFILYSHIFMQVTIWSTLPKAWPGIMRCACLDIREQQAQGSAPDPWFFSSMLLFSTLRMLIALCFPNTSTYCTSILAARTWLCGNFFASMFGIICACGSLFFSDSFANSHHMLARVNEAVIAWQSGEKIHFNSWRDIADHSCWKTTHGGGHTSEAANVDHSQKETARDGAERDCRFHFDFGRRRTCLSRMPYRRARCQKRGRGRGRPSAP